MSGQYPTVDRAFTRVNVLNEQGIWPAVICHQDGTADLTYDPETRTSREDDD